MKRSNLNFIVDAVAFASFVFMVATGVIMEFLLPAGSGHATTIWGLDRHGWGNIHFWMAVVFLATLAVHVYLHWRWIVCVLRGRPREGSGTRVGLGVSALIALLAIAAAPLLSPVERAQGAERERDSRWSVNGPAEDIQGSMSLSDVVATTGVPLDYLVRELGLPSDISPDERVGRLARENGFTVADVREVGQRGAGMGSTSQNTAIEESSLDRPASDTRPNSYEMETHEEEHAVGQRAGDSEAPVIRGSMTLGEVVGATGVPLHYLLTQLRLPLGTPATEHLGRLARAYGFTLVDVRDVVSAYR
jgi:hypothetical protein